MVDWKAITWIHSSSRFPIVAGGQRRESASGRENEMALCSNPRLVLLASTFPPLALLPCLIPLVDTSSVTPKEPFHGFVDHSRPSIRGSTSQRISGSTVPLRVVESRAQPPT